MRSSWRTAARPAPLHEPLLPAAAWAACSVPSLHRSTPAMPSLSHLAVEQVVPEHLVGLHARTLQGGSGQAASGRGRAGGAGRAGRLAVAVRLAPNRRSEPGSGHGARHVQKHSINSHKLQAAPLPPL